MSILYLLGCSSNLPCVIQVLVTVSGDVWPCHGCQGLPRTSLIVRRAGFYRRSQWPELRGVEVKADKTPLYFCCERPRNHDITAACFFFVNWVCFCNMFVCLFQGLRKVAQLCIWCLYWRPLEMQSTHSVPQRRYRKGLIVTCLYNSNYSGWFRLGKEK